MYACTCIYPWLCTKRTHLARKNGPDLEETPGRGSWALLLNPTPLLPPSTACLPVSPVYKGFRPPGTEENKGERGK